METPRRDRPRSTEELLALVEGAHEQLVATFRGRDEAALTRPGSEGWSVKDHIAHVTRWERVALVVYLDGRTFAEAAGMDEETSRATQHMRAETGLNDWFHEQDRGLTLEQTIARFDASYAELLDRIRTTPWSGLEPAEVGGHVAGNTFGHYREHTGYIRAVLGE